MTLKISQGDTLTVKRRLNAGESRRAYERMMTTDPVECPKCGFTSDGEPRIDRGKQGIATILAYLVDWSFTDDNDELVVIRDQPDAVVTAALDALDTESFLEVKSAIETHDIAMMRERIAEKNDQGGGNGSSVTLPSPVIVTGDMSGSES
jgi:hypothetical protein